MKIIEDQYQYHKYASNNKTDILFQRKTPINIVVQERKNKTCLDIY